jgi:hypothetical protein
LASQLVTLGSLGKPIRNIMSAVLGAVLESPLDLPRQQKRIRTAPYSKLPGAI